MARKTLHKRGADIKFFNTSTTSTRAPVAQPGRSAQGRGPVWGLPRASLVATPRDSGRSRVQIPAGASARFSSAKSGRRLHFLPDATNDMYLPGPPPWNWRGFEAIRHRLGFPWGGSVLLTRRCECGSEHQGIGASSMPCTCRQPA